MDGHNGSENIHVHIIINSLRKLDVERQTFMERPCDSRVGYKHHLTNDYLKHLQQSVMDMCHRENLYQVDLLSPSKNKITQKEYWAARRGRFGYPHPDRDRNISDRALGTHYCKDYLMELFRQNQNRLDKTPDISEAEHSPEPPANPPERKHSFFEYNPDYDYSSDPVAILFIKSDLRLVVDLQNNVKVQQSRAYVQEHHYDIRENLQMTFDDISEKCKESRKAVKSTEASLKNINQQIYYTGQYLSNKPVFAQMLKFRNKKKFRQEHQVEITLYESAVKLL